MSKTLATFHVIYDHWRDYPAYWVVRIHRLIEHADGKPQTVPSHEQLLFENLESARRSMPPAAVCIGRHPNDDPVIYEIWMV